MAAKQEPSSSKWSVCRKQGRWAGSSTGVMKFIRNLISMGLQRYKRNTAKTGKAPSKNRKGHAPLLLQATIHIRVCKNTVSDTRCQTSPDPDVRHAKTPDVRHAKTRVSDMPRPGCRTYPVRQSGKLASQRESISVKRGENVRTNSRKRQAAKQKTDKMIQPSVSFAILHFVIFSYSN